MLTHGYIEGVKDTLDAVSKLVELGDAYSINDLILFTHYKYAELVLLERDLQAQEESFSEEDFSLDEEEQITVDETCCADCAEAVAQELGLTPVEMNVRYIRVGV